MLSVLLTPILLGLALVAIYFAARLQIRGSLLVGPNEIVVVGYRFSQGQSRVIDSPGLYELGWLEQPLFIVKNADSDERIDNVVAHTSDTFPVTYSFLVRWRITDPRRAKEFEIPSLFSPCAKSACITVTKSYSLQEIEDRQPEVINRLSAVVKSELETILRNGNYAATILQVTVQEVEYDKHLVDSHISALTKNSLKWNEHQVALLRGQFLRELMNLRQELLIAKSRHRIDTALFRERATAESQIFIERLVALSKLMAEPSGAEVLNHQLKLEVIAALKEAAGRMNINVDFLHSSGSDLAALQRAIFMIVNAFKG